MNAKDDKTMILQNFVTSILRGREIVTKRHDAMDNEQ